MDVHRITSLRNCYLWNITNHMIKRSRLPYRLSIPRTKDMKRMLFYNAIKLWNNVSDNDVVQLCVNSRLAAFFFCFLDDLFFS